MNTIKTCLFFLFPLLLFMPLHAHDWTDASGRFKIDAEFFAASSDTVVLKKRTGSLVGVAISQLSSADQQFVAEKKQALDAEAAKAGTSPQGFQTWTSLDGFELRGRVVAFGRKEILLRRVAGLVTVNDTAFSRLNSFYQYIVPKIVAEYSDPSVTSEVGIEQWLVKSGGNPPAFNIEGVLMKFEDGSELAVPFFLLSEKDLAILKPGWEQWKSEQASEESRKQEDYLMSVQADSYQRQKEADAESHQIQMMQLGLMAVNAGLTSIWEVILQPSPGAYNRTTSVVVPAQNSLQAQELALQKYPGYYVASIRRASN